MTSREAVRADQVSPTKHRFFFRVTGGGSVALPLCIDLHGVREARREAAKLACEIMADDIDGFWSAREWQLTVTDEAGLNLFSLLIFATDSPAAEGR